MKTIEIGIRATIIESMLKIVLMLQQEEIFAKYDIMKNNRYSSEWCSINIKYHNKFQSKQWWDAQLLKHLDKKTHVNNYLNKGIYKLINQKS